MKIPFTNIEITRNEQIGLAAGGIAAAGLGWAAFSLGFGSAPINWLTGIATPLATTAITATAAGIAYGAKKAADYVLGTASDTIESYAASHPESRLGRWTEYTPDKADRNNYDHVLPPAAFNMPGDMRLTKAGTFHKTDVRQLCKDLKHTSVDSFTTPTLTSSEKPVQYTLPAMNQQEIEKIPHHTTRSGKRF
ncbi:hypothetical protein [Candidatus Berkiella aquae]|uniref:Uncharacterized protein n=1 Tax=Candidatus Berkiella aquae TaxID=295108 RepID=A0A0Q9YY63_9GAMM|nr:hypothetical protein [Candidatus Berkiella aquae]MCS5712145.1 hypothetical protein [Candidatus Berkiella aquae]